MNSLWNWFRKKEDTDDDPKVSMAGVLYATRGMDAYDGAYFKFSKKKEICNPNETHKFYLKVAAISYADASKIEGRKCKEINDTFRYTNDEFGSFVFYSKAMQKLRTITCARRHGFPRDIFPYGIGLLHSIIPRYDGTKGSVIVGMYIHYKDERHRHWSKYDGHNRAFTEHDGFTELLEEADYMQMIRAPVLVLGVNFALQFGVCVLYLATNASLVMYDFTNPDLGDTSFRRRINTLFQSGSIIICRSNIQFRFYDKEEKVKINPPDMLKEEYASLMPDTINYEKLANHDNNFVIILKSTESGAFWSIRVPFYRKPRVRMKRPITICIPTDGQFEAVYNLPEGIDEIKKRQTEQQPWNKYIKLADIIDANDCDAFTDINEDCYCMYPDNCECSDDNECDCECKSDDEDNTQLKSDDEDTGDFITPDGDDNDPENP